MAGSRSPASEAIVAMRPPGRTSGQALLDRTPADEVDDRVDLADGVGDLLEDVACRVVEHQRGAERAQVGVRGCAPDRDHGRAALRRELRREATDASGRAEDHHPLIALEVEPVGDQLVGGAGGERRGRGLDV